MSLLKTSFLTALVTVLLTLAGHSHLRQIRREEIARLRTENHQLQVRLGQQRQAQLATTESAGPAVGSMASLAAKPTEVTGVESLATPPVETLSGPGTEYRNEGMGTPLATLQTLAWACDHADAALMEKLLIYDKDARQRILQHVAAQSAEIQSQLPSIEAGAAALYIEDGMRRPYPGAAILALARFEPLRPGRVRVHLPGANGDDFEFQQTPEGWKLAVTLKVVGAYLQETARRQAQP
jgi:hypothetical protein